MNITLSATKVDNIGFVNIKYLLIFLKLGKQEEKQYIIIYTEEQGRKHEQKQQFSFLQVLLRSRWHRNFLQVPFVLRQCFLRALSPGSPNCMWGCYSLPLILPLDITILGGTLEESLRSTIENYRKPSSQ